MIARLRKRSKIWNGRAGTLPGVGTRRLRKLGVGPMRRYCIGADLLDLEDPSKVIAHAREPIIVPNDKEREGYVHNVVYSIGAIVHNGQLIIPYAMSDSATSFATMSLDDLLAYLLE